MHRVMLWGAVVSKASEALPGKDEARASASAGGQFVQSLEEEHLPAQEIASNSFLPR